MPKVYSMSGCNPANRTKWSETVMEQKRSFEANTKESLAKVMSDHRAIPLLGPDAINHECAG